MAKPIAELVIAVETATREHNERQQQEDIARSERTAAINRLNAAQKALDAALAELRKAAPRDSDWSESTRVRHSVPA